MFKNLYFAVIAGNQKAITAGALMLIAGLGLQVGGVNLLDVTVGQLVSATIAAVITGAGVWFKANR